MPDITMPQLGETVTEGTITRWFKQVGDEVAEDEVLFEVSTDKVDSEVPSPAAGYLAEILVQEGETVDVGVKLAVITSEQPSGDGGEPSGGAGAEDEGGDDDEEAPAVAEERGPAAEEGAPEPEAGTVEQEARERDDGAARPGAEKTAQEAKGGDGGAGPAERVPAPAGAPGKGEGGADTVDGRLLSPVVRRLISEHSLDPSDIEGTGAGGRITRRDVLAVIDARGKQAPAAREAPAKEAPPAREAPAPEEKEPAKRAPAAAAATAGEADEVIPFSNIRRRTAEHMVRSKSTSPHVLVAIEVDFEAVDRVRRKVKDTFKAEEGVSLTYLPFVTRATVDALRQFPHLNASVGDDALIVHHRLNVGIAVDIDFQGLIVPVIHDADGLRLRAIAHRIADLAGKARSKKLAADDISGGTFTITNPGPFGTLITAAVINQPQVAILSTDGVKKRPVAVELPDGSDGIAVHPVGNLALTFDHRAFDGAYASAFLRRLKEILETRDWSQEL